MRTAYTAGLCYLLCGNAAVIHSHNYGCIEQFHRNFDLAVSHADHPEIFKGVKTVGEARETCEEHSEIPMQTS